MAEVIAIANHKGGTGKTATTANLGAAFAALGRSVLLLDLDPQRSLSLALGIKEEAGPDLYQVLRGEARLPEAIRPAPGGLQLVPGSLDLTGWEILAANEYGREYLLREAMEDQLEGFDLVLIDCPPSLGLLTVNALTAAAWVLVPMQTEFLALEGFASFLRVFEKVKKYTNPGLQILGIFGSNYDARLIIHRDVMELARETYGQQILKTEIRRAVAVTEAQAVGSPLCVYAPGSRAAEDFQTLAEEVLKRLQEAVKM